MCIGMEETMSKVVCEVCGTAFAETADQCPICGTAKTESSAPAAGEGADSTGYAYVKGGRFSQSNVRRHNSGQESLRRTVDEPKSQRREETPATEEEEVPAEMPQRRPRPEREATVERKPRKSSREEPENEQPSNIGLIIIVVVLLLAILSLCAYIAIRYINMNNAKNATEATEPSTSVTEPVDIPCTGLSVAGGITEKEFTDLTQQWLVEIVRAPLNTTDLLNVNYDETLVKVEREGDFWKVTPIGVGSAQIVFSCGDQSVTINVLCNITNLPCESIAIDGPSSYAFTDKNQKLTLGLILEPATTTEEITWSYDSAVISLLQTEDGWVVTPVASGETLLKVTCGAHSASINITVNLEAGFELLWRNGEKSWDITLTGYGAKWKIYNGEVDVSQIAFSSSDESVATVEGGYVYVWKNGDATITAAYGDQVITMIVRGRKIEETTEEPKYALSHTDVTISINETFKLTLKNIETGLPVDGVTFSVSEEGFITVDENGKVTGVASGKVTIYIEYEGVKYECIVRVRTA